MKYPSPLDEAVLLGAPWVHVGFEVQGPEVPGCAAENISQCFSVICDLMPLALRHQV